jgi:hypothetical protein
MNPRKLYYEATTMEMVEVPKLNRGDKVIVKLSNGCFTAYEIVDPLTFSANCVVEDSRGKKQSHGLVDIDPVVQKDDFTEEVRLLKLSADTTIPMTIVHRCQETHGELRT